MRFARDITRRGRGWELFLLAKFLNKVLVPRLDDLLDEAQHVYEPKEDAHLLRARKELKQAAKRLKAVGRHLINTGAPKGGWKNTP